ncbi:hypothetical protein FA95DRAFT_1481658 [Auriscalpium vulgare]|uniref:Uncharacterized protein n=1 Tax=Auriscalpium vulgare TaxID=40419 RepID=A0ACB8SBM1_9AGAM|nr:hypothetical protein FA95DRAFT_1481658 [Auriscalpium vulgare]
MAEARTPPRGSQIVSFAILAHLFRNDFQGAIALSLKAPFRINLHTVDPLIRSLDLPEDLAMEARIFLTHCNAASLVRAHHSFSHHVYNVLSRMKLGALRTLYSTMVIGLGDEYPWLTIDPAKVSPQRPLVFSEYYWAMFVKSFLTLRRRDVVKVMWDDMIGHGHRPGVHIWTTLIRGIGETEGPDEALAVWRAMRDAGVQPDSVAYQAVVAALLRGRRVAEAANLFNEFRRARAKLPNTLSDDPVYNTMLSGYLANNRPGEAHALLEEMKTLGPAPSAITFNTFMGYYLSFHDFKAISAILKDVSARGLADVVTFSILLRSLLHIVPTAEALEKTLTLMAKHSFQPNAISLTSIVSHLCQEKTVDALKAALELVRTMEESGNPSMLPNAVTYTSVLTAVHKWPDLDRRLVEDTTAHIVRKMEERHIAFTKVTYNILISVFLGYQEPEGLRQGMQYYREMMKTGTVLTADTWYIVLRGLRERGEWGIASEVVDDMVQSDATIPEWLGALASDIRREADRRRSSRS